MLTRTAIKFGLALGIATYATTMNSVIVEAAPAPQTRVFLGYQYLDGVRSGANVRRPQVGRPRYEDMRVRPGMARKGGSCTGNSCNGGNTGILFGNGGASSVAR